MNSEVKKKSNKGNKKSSPQQQSSEDDYKKLSKDQEAVAKFLKFNCPTKKASLGGIKVDYFVGSKAVDLLMASQWATGAKNTQILFSNRDACRPFLQELLNKELFHRTIKVYKEVEQQQAEKKSNENSTTPENTPQPRKRKSEKVDATATPTPASSEDKEKQAAKRKFKLDMHDNQIFLDANEAYVWIYDPATTKSIIVGLLLVVGAIGVCLFPLWPSIVREGVYYVSLTGAGFLGFILGLAVLKYILFAAIFIVTVGSVRFWLLPNLTEDVGFFESFQPLYKIKNNNSSSKTTTSSVAEESKKKESTAVTTTTTTTTSEEFNKLPLDEQLMKKFDENISEEDDDDADTNRKSNEVDEADYDVIEKDVDLKNN